MTYSAGDSGHVAVHNAIDATQASVIAAAAASAASAALSASLVGAPADAAVAAVVGDPASDTAIVLSSTYGPSVTYVPSTGVEATDTAAIVAAHTALPANGGTIRLDSGPYLWTADTVSFTKAVHLIGSGPSGVSAASGSSFLNTGTTINCASATGVAIAVNSDGCSFEKLALFNTAGSTPTAGAGIQITTKGKSTRVVDCSFNGFWTNLEFVQGYEWYIDRCHFFDPVTFGIRLRDTDIADAGDGIISNCFIYAGPTHLTPTAGIQWESGGGIKVLGTKINRRGTTAKFTVGINFQVADGISTSVAVVTGNSIENTAYGVLVQQSAGGTGIFSKINISDNEIMTGSNYGIAVGPANTGMISGVVIAGNVGNGGGGLISISKADKIDIGINTTVTGTPLVVGASVTNLFLAPGYSFTTAARPAATAMRAGSTYYDTTLSKQAWSDGTNWKDAAGTNI